MELHTEPIYIHRPSRLDGYSWRVNFRKTLIMKTREKCTGDQLKILTEISMNSLQRDFWICMSSVYLHPHIISHTSLDSSGSSTNKLNALHMQLKMRKNGGYGILKLTLSKARCDHFNPMSCLGCFSRASTPHPHHLITIINYSCATTAVEKHYQK